MLDTVIKLAWIIKSLPALLRDSISCKSKEDWDGAGLEVSKGYNMYLLVVVVGGGRISESLLENDSLCYLSSDFLADSYQEERELTVHHREKKYVSQTFPSSLLSPKLEIPLPKNEKDQVAVTVTEQT